MNSVGALRTAKFTKYLPKYGWEPIVITAFLEGGEGLEVPPGVAVIRTNNKDKLGLFRSKYHKVRFNDTTKSIDKPNYIKDFLLREGSFWFREAFAYPDERTCWKKFALAAARAIIAEESIKVIYSTSPPPTSHLVGSQLQRETGLPWVADYRDLWSDSHQRHTSLRRWFSRRHETLTMRNASAINTVSEPLAKKIGKLLHKEVNVITNGFDHEDYDSVSSKLTDVFTIAYTGSIYEGKQDLHKLFAAAGELLKQKVVNPNKFKLRFFGPSKHKLLIKRFAGKFGVDPILYHGGLVPNKDVIMKQKESTVLVLFGWNDPWEKGIITGKVFEYLGAKRPILLISRHGDEDELVKLIRKTKAGMVADTEEQIFKIIKDWYETFLQCKTLPYKGDPEVIKQFTRAKQTEKLAKIFDSLI